MITYEKCLELTHRFDKVYPGGHSNLRKAAVQQTAVRVFLTKGKGARVWDVDGNEYVDLQGGAGPNILGHCHEEFVEALKKRIESISSTIGSGMLYTTDDIELAEKIEHYVPSAEKVKFCITGTDAVQMAIRLARGYTGRPYFIRFEGGYHGWMDNVLGGLVDRESLDAIRAGKEPLRKPFALASEEDVLETAGRDVHAFEQSFMLPWNDIEIFEKVLERYGSEIALVHMEPIVCNHGCMPPEAGFLEKIRELCTKHGVVLCFDEVITGFRVGLGGAQKELGVTPDLTTFGKAMSAGIPCSAVVGKAEIMDLLKDRTVLGPGTFMGYPLGLTAALATIRILEKDNGAFYKEIDRVQGRLTTGLKEIGRRRGVPLMIQGCRGAFITWFVPGKEAALREEDLAGADWDILQRFWERMAKEGIFLLFGCRWYMCAGITDADIDRVLEAADRSMAGL